MKASFSLFAVTLIALAGCGQIPALEGTVSESALRAPYPRILPLDEVLAAAETSRVGAEEAGARTDARARALQARAAILRRPINSPEDAAAIRASLESLPGPF